MCLRCARDRSTRMRWNVAYAVNEPRKLALAEMYVQGVSTRKVAAITEQLCVFEVSSTQVSQATALLDKQL